MKTVYPETEDNLRNHPAPTLDDAAPEVSIFLPVFNEEPNLRPLHARLDESLQKLGRTGSAGPRADPDGRRHAKRSGGHRASAR